MGGSQPPPEKATPLLPLRLVFARNLSDVTFGRILVGNGAVDLGRPKPAVPLAAYLVQLALCRGQPHAEPQIRCGADTAFGDLAYRVFSVSTWPKWAAALEPLRSQGMWPPWRLERGVLKPKQGLILPVDGVCRTADPWFGWRDDARLDGLELWCLLKELMESRGFSVDDLDPRLRAQYLPSRGHPGGPVTGMDAGVYSNERAASHDDPGPDAVEQAVRAERKPFDVGDNQDQHAFRPSYRAYAANPTSARRALRAQLKILEIGCRSLEQLFAVPVSARLFTIRKEADDRGNAEYHMYQIRDAFVEHELFPQEAAFIYVSMDSDAFVTARAFQERAPKFEILPDDHTRLYTERERKMVDPAQKWVLCSPILQYGLDGGVKEELEPSGMVVFYGKQTPRGSPADADFALALCRDAAELVALIVSPHAG